MSKYFKYGLPNFKSLELNQSYVEQIDKLFEYAVLKNSTYDNNQYNLLVKDLKHRWYHNTEEKYITLSDDPYIKNILNKLKFSLISKSRISVRYLSVGNYIKSLNTAFSLYNYLLIVLFGDNKHYSTLSSNIVMLSKNDIKTYSQYLYTNIIPYSLFEEFNIQLISLKKDNKELKNKLNSIKLDNENLNDKIATLESNKIAYSESNSIISYDYEKIKNRNMNLHKELKRIYRLINKNIVKCNVVPIAKIVS